ncbi:hypothetical protein FGW37_31135 [Streptomyces rectiverticillatus]|uniref:Orn/Lys/Arg family decarboxylase n=1 Tax=Streptomyces rectiverticillatus TaxID=173860 RepID=UPI0015C3A550|nr:hypothetical protein [Streptomyces rectiverticillatus]QLE75448.1 hypothetical protein FGW37_31135 [Streptomyces rectiverticillatus]
MDHASPDHSCAPVLDALVAYHETGQVPFTPPGHKQGRGADPRVREALGDAVFTSDVLATSGLDDRSSSHHVLERAQALMADAVGAEHTFFSTCGSSLSVKAAMLAVAGPHQELIIGRDAHKSVVSGLVLAGIRPVWVDPQWDPDLHLAHPPSAEVPDPVELRLEQVMLPRDAFFGRTELVPWEKAAGRVAAEMLTPYPPGIPAAVPGERLGTEVLQYLRTGVEAGMVVPDAADPGVKSVKVVVRPTEDR